MMKISMQLFTSGKYVEYRGRQYMILHNSLRGHDLYVYLDGLDSPIHTNHLYVTPTLLEIKRKTNNA